MERVGRLRALAPWLLVALACAAAGCAKAERAARVAAARARYRTDLVGFMVLPRDPASRAPVGEVPTSDLELRIHVEHDLPAPLPGLTLDVQRLGPEGDDVERQRLRVWADVASIPAGPGGEIRVTIPAVPYTPGERLHVFVRRDVPAAERGGYRELVEAR